MDLVLNNLQRLICHETQPTYNQFFLIPSSMPKCTCHGTYNQLFLFPLFMPEYTSFDTNKVVNSMFGLIFCFYKFIYIHSFTLLKYCPVCKSLTIRKKKINFFLKILGVYHFILQLKWISLDIIYYQTIWIESP